MTRTVSARINGNLHDELRNRYNQLGCTINEFIFESIKFALYGSSEFTFGLENDETEKEESFSLAKDTEITKPVVLGKVRVVNGRFCIQDG